MAPYSTICKKLRAEIQATLPKAKSKMYHGLPVWFVGENAVVGFKVTSKKTVMLLFWNGQNFDEPALKASGSFEAAEIHYKDVAEMDLKSLKRWLKKAGKDIWDFAALRKSSKY
jgi:hypothetical protein